MRGLVYKDFLVMLQVGKFYLAALGLYFCLTLAGLFDVSFFSTFLAVMVITLPLSSFTYDESAHWNKFAVSTPAGRDGVVRGKYCFLLSSEALLMALVLAVTALFCFIKADLARLPELLITTSAVAWVSLLVNLVIFPLVFRFGPERGRILMMALFVALFLIGFGLASLLAEGEPLPSQIGFGLPAALLSLGVIGFAVSYRISLGIFRRQAF